MALSDQGVMTLQRALPLDDAGRRRREAVRRESGLRHREPLDPGLRPSLVTRLERAPSTARVHPFENQVSEILGFLIDHDATFAASLAARLWSPDGTGLPAAEAIGAFPGGSLKGGELAPHLYPDISICGSGGSFQILVEVKVTAEFHGFPGGSGNLVLQPDAYAIAWQRAAGQLPADRRRVATIAPRAPARPDPPPPLRGGDLEWARDVIPLLLSCARRRGAPADPVGAVALDLAAAVASRLAPPGPRGNRAPSPQLRALADVWRTPLADALGLVEARWPGLARPGAVTIASEHLGAYLTIDTPHCEPPARVWVFITAAGGRYNRPGLGDGACVCLWEPGPRQCPALQRRCEGRSPRRVRDYRTGRRRRPPASTGR